jgi:mannose-6-phosphate isomerase-like protein (cupin superfamily)
MRIFATVSFVIFLSSLAWPQQPAVQNAPAPDLTKAMYMSAKDVSAAVAASAAKQGTNANAGTRVFQLPPYNVNIEHRIAVAQGAAIHDKDAELFYVIDGAATIVTGGKLVDATRNGDNMNGKSIEGGTSQALGKGDFVLVPAGVPHWFSNVQGSLTQMALHLPMPASK